MKQLILNLLDYIRYQVVNDKCTDEELKSFYKMASENLNIQAESKDIAKHFNQPDVNVRNVISRNFMQHKPVRRVLYNFMDFLKITPKKWLNNNEG